MEGVVRGKGTAKPSRPAARGAGVRCPGEGGLSGYHQEGLSAPPHHAARRPPHPGPAEALGFTPAACICVLRPMGACVRLGSAPRLEGVLPNLTLWGPGPEAATAPCWWLWVLPGVWSTGSSTQRSSTHGPGPLIPGANPTLCPPPPAPTRTLSLALCPCGGSGAEGAQAWAASRAQREATPRAPVTALWTRGCSPSCCHHPGGRQALVRSAAGSPWGGWGLGAAPVSLLLSCIVGPKRPGVGRAGEARLLFS